MTTRKGKILATLALVGVFAAGNVSGSAATLLAIKHRIQRVLDGPPESLETTVLVMALDRALGLDRSQKARIEEIHRRHLPELNRVRRQCETPLAAERARVAAEIRTVLRPDQQRKFDELYNRFEERRKRVVGEPPVGPP